MLLEQDLKIQNLISGGRGGGGVGEEGCTFIWDLPVGTCPNMFALNMLPYLGEDVFKTCLEDLLKTCLEDVLKTCLEDMS